MMIYLDSNCRIAAQQKGSSALMNGGRSFTTKDRLTGQKLELEERLANINKAIKLLDENPVLGEFLDVTRGIL